MEMNRDYEILLKVYLLTKGPLARKCQNMTGHII